MNQKLTESTKIKLIMPYLYALVSYIYLETELNDQNTVFKVIGILTATIAFICWIESRIQVGNAFSIAPKSKFIVESGFYSRLRHPVYYFSILAFCGIGLYIFQPFVVISIIPLLILEGVRIKKEEYLLMPSFDKKYSDYKKSTLF